MKINFPITLTAADSRKRTISGTIVTWGERGNTSAGATVFEKGSIDFSKPVKLLLEHDRTRPIGKLMDIINGKYETEPRLPDGTEVERDGKIFVVSHPVLIEKEGKQRSAVNITISGIGGVTIGENPVIDAEDVEVKDD